MYSICSRSYPSGGCHEGGNRGDVCVLKTNVSAC